MDEPTSRGEGLFLPIARPIGSAIYVFWCPNTDYGAPVQIFIALAAILAP